MTIGNLYDADENDTDYEKLPYAVKNLFTEKEIETLKEVQKQFLESSRYVNHILEGKDIDDNIGYIVRDWLGEHDGRGFRNDELLSWLHIIGVAQERVEKKLEELAS